MAGASLSTLQAAVESNIKRTDLTSAVIDSINRAILNVTMTMKPFEMQDLQSTSTTEGTDTYALDSDALTVEQVTLLNVGSSSNDSLQEVDRGSLRGWSLRGRTSDDYGTPNKWIRRNNNLELYDQIPDDNDGNNYNFEVAYIKRPALLASSSPSTTMDLNEEWDEVVEYWATAQMMLKLQEFEKYAIYKQAYTELLQIREDPKSAEAKADEDGHARFV